MRPEGLQRGMACGVKAGGRKLSFKKRSSGGLGAQTHPQSKGGCTVLPLMKDWLSLVRYNKSKPSSDGLP